MNILAVDDERLSLHSLMRAVKEAVPQGIAASFVSPEEALEHARAAAPDVAFLDIEMAGMNGLELARRLKELHAQTNVVFVTGHTQYALDAFSMHVSGYVLKPVSAQQIARELQNLRTPVLPAAHEGLWIRTFGNFEVFYEGKPLSFARSKSKELLAYLIHKRGTSCTVRELAAVLYEERDYTLSLQKQMQTLISTMFQALDRADARDIVLRHYNSLAIDVQKVDCDYYRFLAWDPQAVNAYAGEYMANYSWAEFTVGYLDRRVLRV